MITKILTPFQKFVKIESLSGLLLFTTTFIALLWANSQYASSYESIWQYKLGIKIHNFELIKPLILWINDGLMAIFFFLIGLELKREFLIGELDSLKKAAFPFFAALGGVIVPIALYLLLNDDITTKKGWGIPMATDIAFALAILKIVGNRIPLSLKVFLTAFAIIDDIAAILVIAVFYSANISISLLVYALLLLLFLAFLSYRKIYIKYVFLFVGFIIWLLFLKSGIHPTIAGVLVAFTIPIRQKTNLKEYTDKLSDILQGIRKETVSDTHILSKNQIILIEELETSTEQTRSPLQDLEYKLHNWVAFFIMPVFVLANAGVAINMNVELDLKLITNIALSMLLGKAIGIFLLSYLGVKFKLTSLPTGVNFKQIFGVAILAGVGFTMSIFIANLAFAGMESHIDSAKIGIILGSLIAGILGYFILRFTSKTS